MPVDAREEGDDLVHLTGRGRTKTPDQAALVHFVTITTEAAARNWLTA